MAARPFTQGFALLLGFVVGCGHPPSAAGPDDSGPKTALETIARAYDDTRSDEEIRRDNGFIDAVEAGDVETARQCLADGARVNARYIDGNAFLSAGRTGYTALLYASMDGNVEMVTLLLEHRPDVNYKRRGRSALYYAAIGGHEEVARLLKKAGAEGDPEQIRLTHELIRAACKGFETKAGEGFPLYPGVVRDLEGAPEVGDVIKQGADVNGADPNGYTALMYAANLGLVENVKTLLALGADPDRKSNDGEMALSLTERPNSSVNRDGRKQVVELLKKHAAEKR